MDSVYIGMQAMIDYLRTAMTARSWGQTLSND